MTQWAALCCRRVTETHVPQVVLKSSMSPNLGWMCAIPHSLLFPSPTSCPHYHRRPLVSVRETATLSLALLARLPCLPVGAIRRLRWVDYEHFWGRPALCQRSPGRALKWKQAAGNNKLMIRFGRPEEKTSDGEIKKNLMTRSEWPRSDETLHCSLAFLFTELSVMALPVYYERSLLTEKFWCFFEVPHFFKFSHDSMFQQPARNGPFVMS